ncbi:hypothetical protein K413DRAFT_2400 [Clostridium sp. ASBs410]|nr:hypothetical protein K413DRAFT_2400 [Clostridium sp. ASBs410]
MKDNKNVEIILEKISEIRDFITKVIAKDWFFRRGCQSVEKVLGSGMKIVIIFGVIIGGAALGIAIFLNNNIINGHWESRDEKKERIERELRQMAEKHLENKYGERFVLEQHWYGTGSGSPFPGVGGGTESGDPMYCYAYAENDMDFRFRVYVYPESLEKSLDINNVKEIQDSYSWKFLREKIREYFDTRMAELIPDERKWIIMTADNGLRFGDGISEDSSLEQFFSKHDKGKKIDITINLIVAGEIENAVLQEDLYSVMKEFYEKYDGKASVYSLCFKAEVAEDFINLDEIKEENRHFSQDKRWEYWREKFVFLFRIEDFENN